MMSQVVLKAKENTDLRAVRQVGWLGIALLMVVFLPASQGVGAEEGTALTFRWQPYSQGLPTYALVLTVAVEPTDPAVIYAGTYEPPGLWRSEDRGRKWAMDDLGLEGSPVYAMHWDAIRQQWWVSARDGLYTRSSAKAPWQAVMPQSQPVYAVAEEARGRLYAASEGGMFRSSDGEAWAPVPIAGLAANTTILDLAVSPDGRTLLAGTAGHGLWISRDGGVTWLTGETALPATKSAEQGAAQASAELARSYVPTVLLDPKASGAYYASTSERTYRSSDCGVTWIPVPDLEGRVCAFAVGPNGEVYATLTGRVARSANGGLSWELSDVGLPADDKVLDLAVSAADPALLYAAAWQGIHVSTDSGRSWVPLGNNLGYADVNTLAWDGAGALLAGARSGINRRADDQAAWEPVPDSRDRPVLTFADAGNGRDFYAGLSGGLARSTDGGRTWSEVTSELSGEGFAGLVVDPVDSDHLLAWVAFGRVHESTDGGCTWAARWEGLGTVRPVTAIHRTAAGQIFAGAEDGLFCWESDRRAWQPLTLPLVAPAIFALESDPRNPRDVCAGATDGVWRSSDSGKTWRRWGKGMEGMTVTALAISPADTRIVLAGTRHAGLYMSVDGGGTWQPAWDGRLATASVRDILFSRDGRMVYVASDQGIWQGGVNGAR